MKKKGIAVIGETETEFDYGESYHVYVVFEPETSLENQKELLQEALGILPDIHWTDTKGNALIVILSKEELTKVRKIPQVVSVKVEKEAELTGDSTSDFRQEDTKEDLTDGTENITGTEISKDSASDPADMREEASTDADYTEITKMQAGSEVSAQTGTDDIPMKKADDCVIFIILIALFCTVVFLLLRKKYRKKHRE